MLSVEVEPAVDPALAGEGHCCRCAGFRAVPAAPSTKRRKDEDNAWSDEELNEPREWVQCSHSHKVTIGP